MILGNVLCVDEQGAIEISGWNEASQEQTDLLTVSFFLKGGKSLSPFPFSFPIK